MHDFKRIAQLLRSLGATSEAEALERIPTSGSGIRLSQIFYDRDAPEGGFYDASMKLRNFSPATDPEKAWYSEHNIVSPYNRQRVKNYFTVQDKKTRTQREDMYPPDERWGEDVFDDFLGEEAWGHGPLYRPLPSMLGEGSGMRGVEVEDMPGTFITDFDPGHPTYTHEDKRGKVTQKPLEDYELGLPDERIGTFSVEKGFNYAGLEHTDPRVVTKAHAVWNNNFVKFTKDLEDTENEFTENLKTVGLLPAPGEPIPRAWYLLSRNFLHHINLIMTGKMDGGYTGNRGASIMGAIDRRLDNLHEMERVYITKREASGPVSQRQAEVFSEYLDEVSKGPRPGGEEEWFEKLKIVYAGSVKLMILDPLGLSKAYPEGLKRVLARHQAVHGRPNLPEWRTRADSGPSPRDLIERPWNNPTFSNPRRKKNFDDIPTFTGPMTDDITGPYQTYRDTGEVSPSIGGQIDAVLASIEFEKTRLEQLMLAAGRLVAARNRLPGTKNEDLRDNPQALAEINAAALEFYLRTGELYGSTNIITTDDAVNMSFGIGDGSKMEVFLGGMAVGKTWQSYTQMLAHTLGMGSIVEEFEAGLGPAGEAEGEEDQDLHG
jgi:hypothetical protein